MLRLRGQKLLLSKESSEAFPTSLLQWRRLTRSIEQSPPSSDVPPTVIDKIIPRTVSLRSRSRPSWLDDLQRFPGVWYTFLISSSGKYTCTFTDRPPAANV